jgi:hypothetical protein
MRCCQQLAIKIRAKQAQAQRTEKLKMFASHIVHVSRALATLQKQAFDRCQKILPVATVPCPVPSLLSITDARIAESELHSKLKSFVEQVYFSRIFIFSSSIFNLVFTIALFSLIWMPHCSSSSYRPHPRVNKKMFTSNPSPNK